MIRRAALAFLASTATATAAFAQANNSKPQPVPVIDTIPAAADKPYPGTLTLDIDATDTARGIYTVRETIPVAGSGEMVLLYPKWIPGGHTPRNEVDKVVGLHVSAGGKAIAVDPRPGRRLRVSHRRAQGREVGRRSISSSSPRPRATRAASW